MVFCVSFGVVLSTREPVLTVLGAIRSSSSMQVCIILSVKAIFALSSCRLFVKKILL